MKVPDHRTTKKNIPFILLKAWLFFALLLLALASFDQSNVIWARELTPPQTADRCDLLAAVETFSDQISAAKSGATICLASGHYGVWKGANKPIVIKKQIGAAVTVSIDFTTGASGFTLDGLTISGGKISGGATNITIKNAEFTDHLTIDGVANANILLDHNTHFNINSCITCTPAAVHLAYSSPIFSGVTVQNSLFQGGNADGIQAGTGLNILNNRFIDIAEHGHDELHTDPIQLIGAKGAVVRGNYIYNSATGIVAYDGLDSATIEDNVIDLVSGRWGIELYSDKNSLVRHNTLVYRRTCEYAPCGQILLDRKPEHPAGSGTIIENNIATRISFSNGSSAAVNRNNIVREGGSGGNRRGIPQYEGGNNGLAYESFVLTNRSPGKAVGRNYDDAGARLNGRLQPRRR